MTDEKAAGQGGPRAGATIAGRPLIAGLPMYDWPELRPLTDRLWRAIARELRAEGFRPPATLARDLPLEDLWLDPKLLLGQTCGLPYMRNLRGRVALLGSPSYRLAGCSPGHYCSAVVVRSDDPARDIAGLAGRRAAFNHPGSQSGEGAPRHVIAPLARGRPFFSVVLAEGSHRGAIRAVAAGRADVAAIDAVSWELALRHEPAAADLRVLARTPETPGLPFITACRPEEEVARLRAGVTRALAGLDPETRDGLLVEGFVAFDPADYDVIAARDGAAAALGYPRLA